MKPSIECERAAREIPPSTPLARHGRRATVADRGSRAWPPLSATHAMVMEGPISDVLNSRVTDGPAEHERHRPEREPLLAAGWEADGQDAEHRILFCAEDDPNLVVHHFAEGSRLSACGEHERYLGWSHRNEGARRCAACVNANRTDDSLHDRVSAERKRDRSLRLPHGAPQ